MEMKISWPMAVIVIVVLAGIFFGLFAMQSRKADAQARSIEDGMQQRYQSIPQAAPPVPQRQ